MLCKKSYPFNKTSRVSGGIIQVKQVTTLVETPVFLLRTPVIIAAQEPGSGEATGHSFDMTIDHAQIRETARLGPRSFSPYANRSFPTRPLWGDQPVHSGWSFDAGFVNALSPEDSLRFARGEQVKTTFGVPIQLSRPLDWLAMTDHSDLLGIPPEGRSGAGPGRRDARRVESGDAAQ
jgi:hypothetical protein